MAKPLATWLVKIVARAPEDDESVEGVAATELGVIVPPTNAELESMVVLGIQASRPELRLTASAERTDI